MMAKIQKTLFAITYLLLQFLATFRADHPLIDEEYTSWQKDFDLPSVFFQSQDVIFQCRASSNLTLTYHWFKDGHVIDVEADSRIYQEIGDLHITDLDHAKDDGVYQCSVENEEGSVVAEIIKFKVTVFGEFVSGSSQFDSFQTIEATIGQPLQIACPKATYTNPKVYDWGFANKHGLATPVEQNSRVKVLPDGVLSYSYLLEADVRNINKHAQGIRCIVYSGRRYMTSVGIRLKQLDGEVKESPPSFIRSIEGEMLVAQHASLSLFCSASGNPAPEVSWSYEGIPIASTNITYELKQKGSLLKLTSASLNETGRYSCEARNEIDGKQNVVKASAIVTVDAKPTWTVVPHTKYVTPGSNHKLRCAAAGVPTPTIRWEGTDDHEMNDGNVATKEGFLEIRNTIGVHKYKCLATNRHGTISAIVTIIGAVPTDPPTTTVPPPTVEAKIYMNNEDTLPSKELSEESQKNLNGASHMILCSTMFHFLLAFCLVLWFQ